MCRDKSRTQIQNKKSLGSASIHWISVQPSNKRDKLLPSECYLRRMAEVAWLGNHLLQLVFEIFLMQRRRKCKVILLSALLRSIYGVHRSLTLGRPLQVSETLHDIGAPSRKASRPSSTAPRSSTLLTFCRQKHVWIDSLVNEECRILFIKPCRGFTPSEIPSLRRMFKLFLGKETMCIECYSELLFQNYFAVQEPRAQGWWRLADLLFMVIEKTRACVHGLYNQRSSFLLQMPR